MTCPSHFTLQWRHNEHNSVSNHQPNDCLPNGLFGRRSKVTSKLRVTGLCVGNSPLTGEFPAQKASNVENVSIWWRHHEITVETNSQEIEVVDVFHLNIIYEVVDVFHLNTIYDNSRNQRTDIFLYGMKNHIFCFRQIRWWYLLWTIHRYLPIHRPVTRQDVMYELGVCIQWYWINWCRKQYGFQGIAWVRDFVNVNQEKKWNLVVHQW